jgi:glycosyltransferase involved in cell wall biosynthesis
VGGTETQLAELIKHINRERFDVRLACIHNRGALDPEAIGSCGKVQVFPLKRFYDLNALIQVLKLRSTLLEQDIDVLHTHDFYSGVLGTMAARLAGIRVLASQRHLKLSSRRVHEWGTLLIHRLSDQVLVNSEAVRQAVLAQGVAGAHKVTLVHNGVRCAGSGREYSRAEARERILREMGLREPVNLAVTIARLEAVKGHRFLLDAAAALAMNYPLLHFVLIGGGVLADQISSQVSRLGLDDRVHMLGERSDVLDILPGFDLSILPSLHEGFPNAVMESMAAGVPVISTEVGGVVELISDTVTGYLVPSTDSAALERKIAFAIDNPALTAEVALRGREFVTGRFSMARMVASVEETYERLMLEPKVTPTARSTSNTRVASKE